MFSRILLLVCGIFVLTIGFQVPEVSAVSPDIIISQIKVTTSGQFITLYNNTNQSINMSTVAVQYFNHYLLSNATSSKTISLDGTLPAHGYYMVNDGPVVMCYQMSITSASMSFSTKNGLVQIVRLSQQANGNVSNETQDFVSWSSGTVAGVQTMPGTPAFLQRQINNSAPVAGGNWQTVQPSSNDPCSLVTYVAPSVPIGSGSGNQLLPPTQPPATIVSISSSGNESGVGIPAGDVGLMAPELSELLPNPKSPQTDASDEFVEIYNPNSKTFDLSGFKIQTQSSGSSTKHTYTFPNGTKIAGKSWAAYPSSNISVSLSNSGAKVSLLDPLGAVIGSADEYSTAKDGLAWALANGKWYWTSTPTPNAANVITAGGSAGSGTGTTGGAGTVKGASTSGSTNNFASAANGQEPAPVHPALLAGVGGLAILYGIYEYRNDIGNWLYRLKQYREARGKAGK